MQIIENGELPGPLYVYDEITSTLDAARELLQQRSLPEWGSVLARSQTGGRGQLRRPWSSPPGNIYAALRLPATPPLTDTAAAPAAGVLVAEGLRAAGLDIGLKWPNDLVTLHRGQPCKVGGILLEEYGGAVLAGIGINLRSSPPRDRLRRGHALNAVHIGAISPEFINHTLLGTPEGLWKRLVRNIYFWYGQELPLSIKWRQAAEARLLWRGEHVLLTDDGREVQGRLLGLGPSGGVRLRHDGRTEEFLSGSLSGAAGTERP